MMVFDQSVPEEQRLTLAKSSYLVDGDPDWLREWTPCAYGGCLGELSTHAICPRCGCCHACHPLAAI